MSAEAKRGPLVYALARLSERERWLLGLLALVFVPAALVIAVALPLIEARDAARAERADAVALRDWVADQVRTMPAEGAQIDASADTPQPIGISAIEQSLVDAGLRAQVTDLSNRDDGGVDLALDAVPFEALTAWLARVSPGWGYRIAAFRIDRDEPGLVRASFDLEPGA